MIVSAFYNSSVKIPIWENEMLLSLTSYEMGAIIE